MIRKYIKIDPFFKDFLPQIKNHRHKVRGKNGRGNPLKFTKKEKEQIKEAITKLLNQIK